jgi:hypothetical protein
MIFLIILLLLVASTVVAIKVFGKKVINTPLSAPARQAVYSPPAVLPSPAITQPVTPQPGALNSLDVEYINAAITEWYKNYPSDFMQFINTILQQSFNSIEDFLNYYIVYRNTNFHETFNLNN